MRCAYLAMAAALSAAVCLPSQAAPLGDQTSRARVAGGGPFPIGCVDEGDLMSFVGKTMISPQEMPTGCVVLTSGLTGPVVERLPWGGPMVKVRFAVDGNRTLALWVMNRTLESAD